MLLVFKDLKVIEIICCRENLALFLKMTEGIKKRFRVQMSREEINSPRFVQPLNTFLCSFHHQFVLCLELPFQKLSKHGK